MAVHQAYFGLFLQRLGTDQRPWTPAEPQVQRVLQGTRLGTGPGTPTFLPCKWSPHTECKMRFLRHGRRYVARSCQFGLTSAPTVLHFPGEARSRCGLKLLGQGDFWRHPEDTRDFTAQPLTKPADEFVLRFQKPQ